MKLEAYEKWMKSQEVSEELKKELDNLGEEELFDRFHTNLEFGTAGLRGVMGAGINRVNEITIGLATQGFADYLNEKFEKPTVAIAYDSRNNSAKFAKITALTFAANGIKAYLYETLEPTPILSYTIRKLNCSGGVVVTASHNKKQYNGYKVYNEFGGQITADVVKLIASIDKLKEFSEIKKIDESKALADGLLEYLDESVLDTYYEKVTNLAIRKDLVKERASEIKIAYTPLHGTGGAPVQKALKNLGFNNLVVVKEQEMPNGDFPTLSYPNPEDPKAFEMAIELAKKERADVIFGTDPDCDRLGLMARDKDGNYGVIYGNQIGVLFTDYVLNAYKDENKMPSNGYVVKTIVTSDAIDAITKDHSVRVLSTLTGFKNIAEQMRVFSDLKGEKYLFGFEESHGYLGGDFVRDKDGVTSCTLAAEMSLYYKTKGKTLFDALDDIYNKYGFFKEHTVAIEIDTLDGSKRIAACMEELRNLKLDSVSGKKFIDKYDFKDGIVYRDLELPKSNVLRFEFEDNYAFMARPSGTEPKLKIYLFVKSDSRDNAEKEIKGFTDDVMKIVNKFLEA